MRISYTTSFSDYLTVYFYTWELNNKGKKLYGNLHLTYPIIVFLIIGTTIKSINIFLLLFLFISAILWFIFYPFLSRRLVIAKVTKEINRYYKNQIGSKGNLILENDEIIDESASETHFIKINSISSLVELKNMYLLYYDVARALILQKNDDANVFLSKIEEINNIKRITDLKWKY